MSHQSFRSFRLVCSPQQIPLVEALLHAQGFSFTPEPFSAWARRLEFEPFPLGGSLAARFGYLYIQDRSSMLPPLALAPHEGAAVLDMCASPGSKTGFLGQLVGPAGFVLGNEPGKARLGTLRRNLAALNLLQCATISYPGEAIPLPEAGAPLPAPLLSPAPESDAPEASAPASTAPGWEYIQLDPPCSGWGTVEKNPQVLALWQGDKVKPLIALQRQLLAQAYRLLRPGGRVVYSTCTTNVAENEEQLAFACDSLGFHFVPLEPPAGFAFEDPALPSWHGVLRVATGADGQGFFVAALEKPAAAPLPAIDSSLALPANQPDDEGIQGHLPPQEPRPHRGGQNRDGYHKAQTGAYRKKKEKTAHPPAERVLLPQNALAAPFVRTEALPPGDLGVFSDTVHFLPAASRQLLPPGFNWKGFPLGRFQAGGVRVHPGLHVLMPSLDEAMALGLTVLNLEEPEPLMALFSGQSLTVDTTTPEVGLYFRGLPLCRLTVKGRRALLPQLA